MPLSASLKYTFRQLLEYEAAKPDVPEGYNNDDWDAAWQEAIVFALTTASSNADDEILNKFHESLRDMISAIHRYMNPYIFNKIKIQNSDLPPLGCKDPDSYFPLVQEVYDYLFGWLCRDLSEENKNRIGAAPSLPPHLKNLRVHQLPTAERLIYNGLNQGQYKAVTILLEAFEAFYRNENMSESYRDCSIAELETLTHLLEQNGVFSDEEDEALADLFSIASAMDENSEAFAENYRNFKVVLREELLQYKNRVQEDLNHFPGSLKNNTLTDIAMMRSASHEKLVEFYKRKDLWSAKRLGAMLSMIPPAGWKVFLETGWGYFLVAYNLVPKSADCCFDAFIHLRVEDWPALLALPNVKYLLRANINDPVHFVNAINRVPIPKRWDILMIPEVINSLTNIHHERTFDWFVDNLLLQLPIDRRTEALFLPPLVEAYGKYISTRSGLKKLLQHVSVFRMKEFIELPGISLKMAQFLALDATGSIMALIPEELKSHLYLNPVIGKVLCEREDFYGIKEIIHKIPHEKRLGFLQQSHVKTKLNSKLISGLKMAQILSTLSQTQWNTFMQQYYIAAKPLGMRESALRLAKAHLKLDSNKCEHEKYLDRMHLIADEFVNDKSGQFITTAHDIPGTQGLFDLICILPLEAWPKLLTVEDMKNRLTREIARLPKDSMNDKHTREIAQITNLIKYLKMLPEDKRWSFLALDLEFNTTISNAIKSEGVEGDELLSILNPEVGEPNAKNAFLTLLKQMNCASLIQRELRSLFFNPTYESPVKKVYDGLERSLNKSRACVTYK